ncbi:MAG: putative cupredoxin-like copper-binding protein [Cocleimonas sp.]|jgi:uncharacterized cupredoxin-like copper-binding protein
MKKINTVIFVSLLALGFSGSSFSAGSDDHSHGHSKAKSTEGHDEHAGHQMSAVGMPVASDMATKTITVHMMDSMKFNFSDMAGIKKGDTIKFVVMNKGRIPHEFGIGSVDEQTSHRKMMQSMPGMKHEDGNTVSVEPGKSKEIVWQFIGDSIVQFACNIPGHFEAGMHTEVKL